MPPRTSGPNAQVSITYVARRSFEQIAAAEAVSPLNVEFARFLHERGNLASGLAVVNFLQRVRGSRAVTDNIRTNEVVMQILRDVEAQGYVRISWSDDTHPRPLIVLLTFKGYKVIEGHICHSAMCHAPQTPEQEVAVSAPSLWRGGRKLYFVAALHESGNHLDNGGVKRTLVYLKGIRLTRPQFVGLLESQGWVKVEWTSRSRQSIVSVRLLPWGLEQLLGHQCGANCKAPLQTV